MTSAKTSPIHRLDLADLKPLLDKALLATATSDMRPTVKNILLGSYIRILANWIDEAPTTAKDLTPNPFPDQATYKRLTKMLEDLDLLRRHVISTPAGRKAYVCVPPQSFLKEKKLPLAAFLPPLA
jgi:hypothetical protein